MLILTRKDNESLFIGDDIEITVLGVKGNQVRIGINAPKNIDVHREEVYRRIEAQKSSNSSRKSNLSLNKSTQLSGTAALRHIPDIAVCAVPGQN